jgi:hypothetical protein
MKQIIVTTTLVKWHVVEDFPEYSVSNNGLVKKHGILVKQFEKRPYPYLFVFLVKKHMGVFIRHKRDVHRMVWQYFGEAVKPFGYDIHHKDENKQNNHISNMELKSKKEHGVIHARSHVKKQIL